MKEKIKKNNVEGELSYVTFCQHCGLPRAFSKEIMIKWFITYRLNSYICIHCARRNRLPAHFLNILDELIKAI